MDNSSLKIMIVDDIIDNIMAIRLLIEEHIENVSIVTCTNGKEGVELAIDESPDIIISDVYMPVMDGLEMSRVIKKIPEIADIPIVFVTASGDNRDLKIKAINVGVEGFLQKPIDVPELIAQVKAMEKIRVAAIERKNEKIRLEKLVDQRTKELKTSQMEAERAKEAQSRFLANMSHEIRTPLNGVMGMMQLTLSTQLDEEQIDNLSIAMASARSLLAILNDILDYTKIEDGYVEILREDVAVKKIEERLSRLFMSLVVDKGLTLRWDIDDNMPESILTDELRLVQILTNLISNAIKFTDSGEVCVSIRPLKRSKDGVKTRFSVKDTGIGIDPANREILFERFRQVDESFTKNYGGTGLGLAISKNLVGLLGGELKVASQVHEGSEFWFDLNLECIERKVQNKVLIENQNRKHLGTEIKILLVDDCKVNQKIVKTYLQNKEYEVDVASNGKEGVDLYKDQPYDIVLMDISMPVMDGFKALEIMKEHDEKAIFIAMTAYAFEEDRKLTLEKGFDKYMSKPIDLKDLVVLLKTSMN